MKDNNTFFNDLYSLINQVPDRSQTEEDLLNAIAVYHSLQLTIRKTIKKLDDKSVEIDWNKIHLLGFPFSFIGGCLDISAAAAWKRAQKS